MGSRGGGTKHTQYTHWAEGVVEVLTICWCVAVPTTCICCVVFPEAQELLMLLLAARHCVGHKLLR